ALKFALVGGAPHTPVAGEDTLLPAFEAGKVRGVRGRRLGRRGRGRLGRRHGGGGRFRGRRGRRIRQHRGAGGDGADEEEAEAETHDSQGNLRGRQGLVTSPRVRTWRRRPRCWRRGLTVALTLPVGGPEICGGLGRRRAQRPGGGAATRRGCNPAIPPFDAEARPPAPWRASGPGDHAPRRGPPGLSLHPPRSPTLRLP